MSQNEDAMRTLFESDLRRLRAAAPSPVPAWRVARSARTRAAQRVARNLRGLRWAAIALLAAAAVPWLWQEPRALPGLIAPLLIAAFVCWRGDPDAAA